MSINFIPTVWSARLLANLEKALVYSQPGVVNKDYEGEIKGSGISVKIASLGDVSVNDYTRNTDLGDPEELTDAEQTMVIDQAKYFNFQIDDVDRAQARINYLDEAMRRAAYKLRDGQDAYVATIMDAAVPAANKIGSVTTPIIPTKADAYEYLVDLSVKLDEANCPQEGRWVVVPAWFQGLLLKDDRFVKSGTASGDATLRNGQVGEAAGFTVYKSNNVPNTTGTKYKILAGHPMATTVAEQIVSIEKYRMEKRFADAVKGLHVYGAKVTRPGLLACLIANAS